jgi:DNA repair exonuclease SbcCD nuclease subunit
MKIKPYGVISDSHNHGWDAFSSILPSGVNNRLQQTLDETTRCADEVLKAGGNRLYHGGDLFHVRGKLAPSVLNPTLDCYRAIIKKGVQVVINAGNHDLEDKKVSRVSSAITALADIGCIVVNSVDQGIGIDGNMVIVPWIESIVDLKATIEMTLEEDRAGIDLLIHAPVDGVMPGIPDHGLDPAYLAGLGFRRVFAGHYHAHKEVVPGKVWSIGSLTSQTWSDVGAKAGFLIVDEEKVRWFKSHAPGFVEISGATDPSEIPLIVDGNYVRCRVSTSKQSEIESLRDYLVNDCHAAGAVIIPEPAKATVTRTTGPATAGITIEASIGNFIHDSELTHPKRTIAACESILAQVRSVA